MAGNGVWKVKVKSDEAIKKESKPNEGCDGLNFRLRFKTGEYAKDADSDLSELTSCCDEWK